VTPRAGPIEAREVVAAALGCEKESLTEKSGMYRDHGWDSFGHISVITAIESALGVRIDNDAALRLTTMTAINEFFEQLQARR
jgi:citrate synthase